MNFRIVTLIIALAIPPAHAVATNYYISSTGNDNNNGTSEKTPWQTLDKLYSSWNLIVAGDSVLFRRDNLFAPKSVGARYGLLRIPNLKKGTAKAPIVIGAYGTGDRPIISGQNCSDYHQVFRSGALEYFVVQDIEFRGAVLFKAGDDKVMGIKHFKLLRIKLQGGIDKGNSTKITFDNPYAPSKVPFPNNAAPIDKVEIAYCEFYDTEGEDAVNIGSVGDSLWVHHNVWKNVSEEALDVAGGCGHLIEYNFVSGTTVNGMKFHCQLNNQHGIVIRGNMIIRVGRGTTGGNGLVIENVSDSKVYNNTLASYYSAAFGNTDRLPPVSYYGDFKGNEIFNNIFLGAIQVYGTWENVDLGAGNWYSSPVFKIWYNNSFHHNIYWNYPGGFDVFRFWEGYPYPTEGSVLNRNRTVYSNNQQKFITEWQSKSGEAELMTDPLLTNPSWSDPYTVGDFTPLPSSPAIHAGVPVPGYTRDLAGLPVPAGSKPAIGAYQLTSTSGSQGKPLTD